MLRKLHLSMTRTFSLHEGGHLFQACLVYPSEQCSVFGSLFKVQMLCYNMFVC